MSCGRNDLRLARNRLTDSGLAALAALPQLTHLNLYGNSGVTDTGLALLATSGSLRELYVWQTGASAEGVAQLRAQRPKLIVDFGAESTAAARQRCRRRAQRRSGESPNRLPLRNRQRPFSRTNSSS